MLKYIHSCCAHKGGGPLQVTHHQGGVGEGRFEEGVGEEHPQG